MDFNYEKAYFTQALPAYENLTYAQKTAHEKLLPLVKDLRQEKVSLNIPVSDEMKKILSVLSCQEIAELSRTSYFTGHWKPSLVKSPFENSAGESWKITNVCDQILRKVIFIPYSNGADTQNLFQLPHNILIHDGKFRVTFSSSDCWLWEEFGLATVKNLEIFKNCCFPFRERTLDSSAKKLIELCGDLWGNVDDMPNNIEYEKFLLLKKEQSLVNLKKRHADRLTKIENDIENSKVELAAFGWLINSGIREEYIENCIFYSHEGKFAFGWREALTEKEKDELKGLLKDFPFAWEFSKK